MLIHNIGLSHFRHQPISTTTTTTTTKKKKKKKNIRPQQKKPASHNVNKVANFQSPLIYLNAQPVKFRVPKKETKERRQIKGKYYP